MRSTEIGEKGEQVRKMTQTCDDLSSSSGYIILAVGVGRQRLAPCLYLKIRCLEFNCHRAAFDTFGPHLLRKRFNNLITFCKDVNFLPYHRKRSFA